MQSNFTQALDDLRKKSRLMGVEPAKQEIAGIAEGEGKAATDRLVRMKQVQLEKENLEQRKQEHADALKQQEEDREAAESATTATTTTTGLITGAYLGTAAYGPIGGAVGAGIGAAAGFLSSECIIITACTSSDSYEVEISREFRDKYMSNYHLGGYYALASRVAPMIRKSHFLKLITKKFLVDRLVDYGEWVLGYKPKMRFRTSRIVTAGFLKLCAAIGMEIEIQPYIMAHR